MSDPCGHSHPHACAASAHAATTSPRYQRVLWAALFINATLFLLELRSGLHAESVALLADALDFAGDAISYALALWALRMTRARSAWVAVLKGWAMGGYGVLVLLKTVHSLWTGTSPEALTMGWVGALALSANIAVAVMLYTWREGDANMRAVWLCSRNDAIGNLAVMAAALGVLGTSSAWPDLAVATLMAVLGLSAARSVITQARQERRQALSTAHTST